MVVLDHKQHGHFLHRGQVQRFVNLAGAGGAVAEDGQAENVLALPPRRPGGAHHQAGHLAQVADHGEPPPGGVAVVGVPLAAVRGTVGVAHELAEDLVRRGAQQHVPDEVAVHDRHHVAARPQRQRDAHRRGLVAAAVGHGPLDVALLEQFRAAARPSAG